MCYQLRLLLKHNIRTDSQCKSARQFFRALIKIYPSRDMLALAFHRQIFHWIVALPLRLYD